MKRSTITTLLLLAIVAISIYQLSEKACNKPGSVAEKINWAGHNCPR
jgi:hypothetical protein